MTKSVEDWLMDIKNKYSKKPALNSLTSYKPAWKRKESERESKTRHEKKDLPN